MCLLPDPKDPVVGEGDMEIVAPALSEEGGREGGREERKEKKEMTMFKLVGGSWFLTMLFLCGFLPSDWTRRVLTNLYHCKREMKAPSDTISMHRK